MFISAAVNTAQSEVRLNLTAVCDGVLGSLAVLKPSTLFWDNRTDFIRKHCVKKNATKRSIAIQSAFDGIISSLCRENLTNSLCIFISKGGSCVQTEELFRSQGCVRPVAEIARHTHTHTHKHIQTRMNASYLYPYTHANTSVPALPNADPIAILVVGP